MINNSNNGHHQNGNGHKSNGLSRMNVETKERDVSDGDKITAEELNRAAFSKPGSDTTDASEFYETNILLDDTDDTEAELLDDRDDPARHDFKRSGERRGRLRRIIVSLLIVCVLLIVSALAMYFWLMGGTQQGDMSLRVQTNGAADGRSEENAGALTAEEINRAMNNPPESSNQPSLSENTLNGSVPLTARPPIDSYSTTYNAPLQNLKRKPQQIKINPHNLKQRQSALLQAQE